MVVGQWRFAKASFRIIRCRTGDQIGNLERRMELRVFEFERRYSKRQFVLTISIPNDAAARVAHKCAQEFLVVPKWL